MDLVKTLAYDVLVRAAIKRLFTLVPFLGWGPIGMVVGEIIIRFTDVLYELGKELFGGWAFKFINEQHQEAFDNEFIKLKMIENDASATKKEIQDAIKKAQDRMADFVVIKRLPPSK